jgi:hypothetical protein
VRWDEPETALEMRRHAPVAGDNPAGAAPAGVPTHGTHSGGVGAPPGDTTVPRQELADGDVRSLAAADARLWNGAETGARSPTGD